MGSYAKRAFTDEKRWVCIYPAYINGKKTLAEGRRIPKERAIDNPTCQEMQDILKAAGFNTKVEKKMYCRELNRDMQFQGRIRIQLKADDGSPVKENLPTKRDIMLYTAEMIPKLKTRQVKGGSSSLTTASGQSSNNQQNVPVSIAGGSSGTLPSSSQGGKQKKKKR